MIDCSLGEVEAYARRAARGAGMSWGLAEEAGKASRWLVERGLPGVQALLKLLSANDGRPYARMAPIPDHAPWRSADGDLCPVCCGAALSDRASAIPADDEIVLRNLASPLLLAPFVGWLAQGRSAQAELMLQEFRITVTARGLSLVAGDESDLLVAHTAEATLSLCPDRRLTPTHPPDTTRVRLPTAMWRALDDFGRRTYVPASTESRRRGAGAGRIDND